MECECKQSFTNFTWFFFVVKFAFLVIFKTPSSVQNCHEVNQSWTLPLGVVVILQKIADRWADPSESVRCIGQKLETFEKIRFFSEKSKTIFKLVRYCIPSIGAKTVDVKWVIGVGMVMIKHDVGLGMVATTSVIRP